MTPGESVRSFLDLRLDLRLAAEAIAGLSLALHETLAGEHLVAVGGEIVTWPRGHVGDFPGQAPRPGVDVLPLRRAAWPGRNPCAVLDARLRRSTTFFPSEHATPLTRTAQLPAGPVGVVGGLA